MKRRPEAKITQKLINEEPARGEDATQGKRCTLYFTFSIIILSCILSPLDMTSFMLGFLVLRLLGREWFVSCRSSILKQGLSFNTYYKQRLSWFNLNIFPFNFCFMKTKQLTDDVLCYITTWHQFRFQASFLISFGVHYS